jgi:5-methylthioadenosine/S-adenosylhomocysteine deaminase
VTWIEGNRVKAVLDAEATPSPGFDEILKPLDVPELYRNRGRWQGSPPYRLAVSGPMGVLAAVCATLRKPQSRFPLDVPWIA